MLLEQAGLDCTEAFEDVGHSEEAREMLQQYLVGNLDQSVSSNSSSNSSCSGSSNGGLQSVSF